MVGSHCMFTSIPESDTLVCMSCVYLVLIPTKPIHTYITYPILYSTLYKYTIHLHIPIPYQLERFPNCGPRPPQGQPEKLALLMSSTLEKFTLLLPSKNIFLT
uniref:Uncharacterized protein n=1 Tax=Cacopsylla melanoneura TaxID=428564 RepID=A0A8D8QE54_9HEMI